LQDSSERPVFVLGSGRCGSTLLQSILNQHPDFLIWGEHGGWLRPIADAYYVATTDDHALTFLREGSLSRQIKGLRTPGYLGNWDNCLQRREYPRAFGDLVRSLFVTPASTSNRWGFKEIRYCLDPADRTPDFLLECFPEAMFLIVVRNPWHTVFSMLSAWRRNVGLDVAAIDRELDAAWNQWNTQYANLSLFHQSAPHNSAIVRFEEMLDPAFAEAIFSTLGTDTAPDVRPVLKAPREACIRNDEFAALVRERMHCHAQRWLHLSHRTRAFYDYEESPAAYTASAQ